jgi:hypothetical protein
MGFTFRRSVKMGPLRFNFSTRGVGVSAGIRGARVSVGPRGTYVTIGRGGFQYRAKLGADTRRASAPPVPGPASPSGRIAEIQDEGQIFSASVAELAATSPEQSLQDIQKRVLMFNWFAVYAATAGVLLLAALALPTGAWLVCLAAAMVAGVFIFRWDSERRTARILYDVDDPEILERMEMNSGVGEWLSRSSRVWHVYSAVQTGDWKHNAGASTIVKRTPTRCTRGTLPRIELNIEPWCVPVGPQRLLFLPDRMLVLEGNRFAGVPYEQLSVAVQRKRFVEEEAVPPGTPSFLRRCIATGPRASRT